MILPIDKTPYLSQAYESLDYQGENLVDINEDFSSIGLDRYLSVGQWIDTAKSINDKDNFKIEKIFFIQDNPFIVFTDASQVSPENLFRVYNSVWSFARPRLVFIENEASITLFDLNTGAVKNNAELKPVVTRVTEISKIGEAFKSFHRQNVESGRVFGDENFVTVNKRADQLLIDDLKKVRSKLIDEGLGGTKIRYAHSLIGRAIFIRYLEDRGVLDKKYFLRVAGRNAEWKKIIETPLTFHFFRQEMKDLIFPRILGDKDLTFAVFQRISEDFNGDSFQPGENEHKVIQSKHLVSLRNFLVGQDDLQQSLFLWAYRFDVIPVDLISSIYEEFYHSSSTHRNTKKVGSKKSDGKGTHYTPSALVDFVLSKVLDSEVLSGTPRVLDAACGSGIFLVESFRRIVRFRLHTSGKKFLEPEELLGILRNQILGIEINPEAIRISAFSLYLSFLNYLKPPNILDFIKKGNKLPNLICNGKRGANQFNILLEANSFDAEKVDTIFQPGSIDVVVGNPPWGAPQKGDVEGRAALDVIKQWCTTKGKPFPDKEPSHAFVWRSLELLKPNGICGLLVSSGLLFKFSVKSSNYKQKLLSTAKILDVISFPNVRDVFFSEAISPFIFIKIQNAEPPAQYKIKFISLRKTQVINKNKVVVIDRKDVKNILYTDTKLDNVWKIYHWGNDYDLNLIKSLKRHSALKKYADTKVSAQGFQVANKSKDSGWLLKYKEMPLDYFDNPFQSIDLTKRLDKRKLRPTPNKVKVRGNESIYQGKRILVRRGIVQGSEPKGRIIARVEGDTFAFNHSIICIKLKDDFIGDTDIIGAIMWSSLFRYYMFMTASTWGTWHQEIHLNEVLEFPVALADKDLRRSILKKVEKLKKLNQEDDDSLFSGAEFSKPDISKAFRELDDLIFDLYKLTPFERSLVIERCQLDIDLYYKGVKSEAVKPVAEGAQEFYSYADQFKKQWSRYLEKDEHFKVSFLSFARTDSLAVVFSLSSKQPDGRIHFSKVDEGAPNNSFSAPSLDKSVTYDTVLRSVSEKEITIIKKNQKRLWTVSEAQADADATLLTVINKTVEIK